jgi:hypothetical protein
VRDKLRNQLTSLADFDGLVVSIFAGTEASLKPRMAAELVKKYSESEHALDDTTLLSTLNFMRQLTLDSRRHLRNMPLRILHSAGNVKLSRVQCAVVTACVFFGVYEEELISKGPIDQSEMSYWNYAEMFRSGNVCAFSCLVNYFHEVSARMAAGGFDGVIVIARGTFTGGPSTVLQQQQQTQQSKQSRKGKQEDTAAANERAAKQLVEGLRTLQGVETAGKLSVLSLSPYSYADDSEARWRLIPCSELLGGKFFDGALTQEEATMLSRPESALAAFYCPRLGPSDTVAVIGCEKFSRLVGSGINGAPADYDGPEPAAQNYGSGPFGRILRECILFADPCSATGVHAQIDNFERDIVKLASAMQLAAAYSSADSRNVACGGFGGTNVQLRFIQIYIAASYAGVELYYCPFSREFDKQVEDFVSRLDADKINTELLYEITLETFSKLLARPANTDLFEEILDLHDDFLEEQA